MEVVLTILIILLWLATTLFGVWVLIHGLTADDEVFVAVGVVIILITVLPVVGYKINSMRKNQLSCEIEDVEVLVVDKRHSSRTTTMIYTGKYFIPMSKPEQYKVTVRYDDVEKTLNNKDLFDAVEIDDKIWLKLYTWKDEYGNTRRNEIKLE